MKRPRLPSLTPAGLFWVSYFAVVVTALVWSQL